MNPHIVSTSSMFELNFPKEPSINNNSYEEIDERLFNTYLNISEEKSAFFQHQNRNSIDLSPCLSEEEESDSSHKVSIIGTGRKTTKHCHVSKKRETKSMKEADSDNDEIPTKSKKSTKSSNKKLTEAANQESADNEKKQKNLYKTELCRNWEETSHCRYGMKCQYAHGVADLREIDRHPKYKTQKCRTFHQTGSCPYGARCTFRHFNLPGDALEMKNLDKEEEEKKQQHQKEKEIKKQQLEKEQIISPVKREDSCSIFSAENQKLIQQNWYLDNNNVPPLAGLGDIHKNLMINQQQSLNTFDPEDSLLPSNAESLLPHQLLFDLESPDEDVDQPRRCPLRDYVNLPSFSNFQAPHYLPSNYQGQQQHQQQQQQLASNCKTFFRPWLF